MLKDATMNDDVVVTADRTSAKIGDEHADLLASTTTLTFSHLASLTILELTCVCVVVCC